MPKTIRNKCLRLQCDDPTDTFTTGYTNEGEPFREGVTIGVENADFEKHVTVMLKDNEAKHLRDFLLARYPIKECGENHDK